MEQSDSASKVKIQRAAKKLFALKGYNGTSTRDIVKEADVNISLIAYYFRGKEGLFQSLFQSFGILMEESTSEISDPVAELTLILSRIIGMRFKDPELVDILQHEVVVQSERIEKIKEIIGPLWHRVLLLLEEGRALGKFTFTNTYNAVSFVMSVAIFPRQNPFFSAFIQSESTMEETITEVTGFILRGLGSGSRPT